MTHFYLYLMLITLLTMWKGLLIVFKGLLAWLDLLLCNGTITFLRLGTYSAHLRDARTGLTRHLTNLVVKLEEIRALMANWLIALDKCSRCPRSKQELVTLDQFRRQKHTTYTTHYQDSGCLSRNTIIYKNIKELVN